MSLGGVQGLLAHGAGGGKAGGVVLGLGQGTNIEEVEDTSARNDLGDDHDHYEK